jgi:hypothetical protein
MLELVPSIRASVEPPMRRRETIPLPGVNYTLDYGAEALLATWPHQATDTLINVCRGRAVGADPDIHCSS